MNANIAETLRSSASRLTNAANDIEGLYKQLLDAQSAVQEMQSERDKLRSDNESLRIEDEAIRQRIDDIQNTKAHTQQENERLVTEKKTLYEQKEVFRKQFLDEQNAGAQSKLQIAQQDQKLYIERHRSGALDARARELEVERDTIAKALQRAQERIENTEKALKIATNVAQSSKRDVAQGLKKAQDLDPADVPRAPKPTLAASFFFRPIPSMKPNEEGKKDPTYDSNLALVFELGARTFDEARIPDHGIALQSLWLHGEWRHWQQAEGESVTSVVCPMAQIDMTCLPTSELGRGHLGYRELWHGAAVIPAGHEQTTRQRSPPRDPRLQARKLEDDHERRIVNWVYGVQLLLDNRTA